MSACYACCSVRAFEGVSCIKISLEIKMIDFESAWALYEISWQHVRVLVWNSPRREGVLPAGDKRGNWNVTRFPAVMGPGLDVYSRG